MVSFLGNLPFPLTHPPLDRTPYALCEVAHPLIYPALFYERIVGNICMLVPLVDNFRSRSPYRRTIVITIEISKHIEIRDTFLIVGPS